MVPLSLYTNRKAATVRVTILCMVLVIVSLSPLTLVTAQDQQQPEEDEGPSDTMVNQNEYNEQQQQQDDADADSGLFGNEPFAQRDLDVFQFLDDPPFPCASLQPVLAEHNDDGEEVLFVRLSSSVLDPFVADATTTTSSSESTTAAVQQRQAPPTTTTTTSSSIEESESYICITTPTTTTATSASSSTTYEITIIPDRLGRYEFLHRPVGYSEYIAAQQNLNNDNQNQNNQYEGNNAVMADGEGYAWNAPSDGIVYCTTGSNMTIIFTAFVEDAIVGITVRALPNNDGGNVQPQSCDSHILGFNGYVPANPESSSSQQQDTENFNSMPVVWSAPRYFLQAEKFVYSITSTEGEVTTFSLTNIQHVFVNGDPGSDTYMTIEISWNDDSSQHAEEGVDTSTTTSGGEQVVGTTERRFYAYFESDGSSTWRMFEARVYDQTQEWITFSLTDEVEGVRDGCFERDYVYLATTDGGAPGIERAEIEFRSLKLAVFLPWENADAMEYCMDPSSVPMQEENSHENNNPMPTPTGTNDGSVLWSTSRYILKSSSFEFSLPPPGQSTTTSETDSLIGASNVIIGGDPGWNFDDPPSLEVGPRAGYMTIEIEWTNHGSQQRFYAYFNSNSTHYNMFEARVRNKYTDEWESFENLDGVVSGLLGSCFFQESLVITNPRGNEIRFDNIALATFLPWQEITDGDGDGDGGSTPVLEARSSSPSFTFGSDEFCNTLVSSSSPDSSSSSGGNYNNNASAEGPSEGAGDNDDAISNASNSSPDTSFDESNAAMSTLSFRGEVILLLLLLGGSLFFY